MKSFITIAMLALVISSCQTKVEDDSVTQFKYYIGQDNFDKTNYFLKSMEAKFEKTYKTGSVDENYLAYLTNVLAGDSNIEFDKNDCDGYYNYALSGMENKFSREAFDTVYFDKNGWLMEIFGEDTMRSNEILRLTNEELISRSCKKGYHKLIHWGKLMDGLKLVSDSDTMAFQYYELRYNLGEVSPEIPAEYFLSIELKPSQNYFYKIFILIELYSKELKKYGC